MLEENEFEFFDELEDDDEEFREALREWLDMFPKDYIAIVNPERFKEASDTIKKIMGVIAEHNEAEYRPKYSCKYDTLGGSILGFYIDLDEYDVRCKGRDIKAIAELLPENATVTIYPKNKRGVKIEIAFYGIKDLY